MAKLLPYPRFRAFDSNGDPLANGKVYTYETETTTPKTTWQDAGESSQNQNPVILDSQGYADIWLNGTYTITIVDENDSPISSTDGVTNADGADGAAGTFQTATATGTVDAITASYSPVLTLANLTTAAFVAMGANTTTTPTFAPDGLTAHTITKKGGLPLAIGDIPRALYVCLVEYNSANTRWELLNPAGGEVVRGACRNLVIKQASNTTATVTYDELVVKTALGGASYTGASGNHTINFAATGANGLDAGSLANSTFYYIYEIYNPATNTFAALGSTSATSPTLPSGYTAYALIGVMLTDGSAHLLVTTQYDREVFYQTPIVIFTNQNGVSSLTSQSISGAVPPTITKTVSGLFLAIPISATTVALQVAADATGYGLQSGAPITTSLVTGLADNILNYRQCPVITSQVIYINHGNASASTNSLKVNSFTI